MSISTKARRATTAHSGQAPRTTRRWPWRVLAAVLLLVGVVWGGLRIPPRPLPEPGLRSSSTDLVALREGLPAPVHRFYRTLYGDQVPTVESAVITGRGTMRINGITMPARFRFSHVTGEAYRHHIETTLFGAPLLTVDEWFLDGVGRLNLPFGEVEGPQTDQGANLALWAEAVWMPSLWVTDPRVAWEPIDDSSARLHVPFGADTETFVVDFDPQTGLLTRMESLRFKSEDAEARTRWINEVLRWGEVDGHPAPLLTAVGWGDEASPWARLRTEGLLYNADVTNSIRADGH